MLYWKGRGKAVMGKSKIMVTLCLIMVILWWDNWESGAANDGYWYIQLCHAHGYHQSFTSWNHQSFSCWNLNHSNKIQIINLYPLLEDWVLHVNIERSLLCVYKDWQGKSFTPDIFCWYPVWSQSHGSKGFVQVFIICPSNQKHLFNLEIFLARCKKVKRKMKASKND